MREQMQTHVELRLLRELQEALDERTNVALADIVGWDNFLNFSCDWEEDEIFVWVQRVPDKTEDRWSSEIEALTGFRRAYIEKDPDQSPYFDEDYWDENARCSIKGCHESAEKQTPLGPLCEKHAELHSAPEKSVEKALVLSTCHMPFTAPDFGDARVAKHEYGYVVFLVDEPCGPEWLKPIESEAIKAGCSFVIFDGAADADSRFQQWEW